MSYKFDLKNKTKIMGILNITPDSFSDGGNFFTLEKAINRAKQIEFEGADIIDIGAQSTRPGFTQISADEEWQRLEPVLKNLNLNIPISIDTFYPEVAQKCLELYNVDIINDVTGCEDPKMLPLIAKYNRAVIITHNKPDMNIKEFFKKKLKDAQKLKIKSSQICFDPGIGFYKSQADDAYIIRNLKNIKLKNHACLVGLSRKRIIGVACGNPPPKERLAGTIAANTICISGGANILRVHDVKEAVQAVKVADYIIKEEKANEQYNY